MADEINKSKLLSYVERLERIGEEEHALAEDKKEILTAAKDEGFVPKHIRKLVALRKQDQDKRRAEEAEFDLYKHAVGID